MTGSKPLAGKIALVTGAGRGIGRAISLRLSQEGAHVIVNFSRSVEPAADLVDQICKSGGSAEAIRADCADLVQIRSMVAALSGRGIKLDILVNNAGRGTPGSKSIGGTQPEEFDEVFSLNTRGLFFVTNEALALMPDGGRIVNISSMAADVRMTRLSAYAGSKAAVNAFTRCWAAELAPRNITVNAIAPGMIDTDLITDNMPSGIKDQVATRHPRRRIGTPEDIANIVAYLCSDDAAWVSGEIIQANGGQ